MSWFGFLLLMWWKHTFTCPSLVLVNTHRPRFEAHGHSQRLVGMEQTGDDGKSDSFHTSKICWAHPSVPDAIATPLEMSGNVLFPCEWLFSLNTAWAGVPQTSGCKLSDINVLYLFTFSIRSTWITETLWELSHLLSVLAMGFIKACVALCGSKVPHLHHSFMSGTPTPKRPCKVSMWCPPDESMVLACYSRWCGAGSGSQ